jgi:hypothetical protein
MTFFCYRRGVHCARTYAALQCAIAQFVATDVDFVGLHKSPDFQVEAENFAITLAIYSYGRDECFCGVFVVDEVAPIARYACRVVQATCGMELEKPVGLEVQRLGVIGREEEEGFVQAIGMAREGQ